MAKMTPEEREEFHKREAAAKAEIWQYLKPGDLITHTVCCRILEEHYFVGVDGHCIVGKPSHDTMLQKEAELEYSPEELITNDILFSCVTHINRCPIDALEFFVRNDNNDSNEEFPF
ncbi:MAG: hypothetical protein JKY94_10395 [Rhodobacteraceae bacterium]|nr:hypothetical protein [Paracoccaceae bacterium]